MPGQRRGRHRRRLGIGGLGRSDDGAVHVVNTRNNGAIPNLPDDCVVEIPGYVDRTGINMPVVGPLPLACAATCNATVSVQRMSVMAAVTGDVTLLKQAMLHDPLTGLANRRAFEEDAWRVSV